MRLGAQLVLPQHTDEHRPERPVLLAVVQTGAMASPLSDAEACRLAPDVIRLLHRGAVDRAG
jgi:hypothetical protein